MTPSKKWALVAGIAAVFLTALSASDARGLKREKKLQAEIQNYLEKQRALAAENQALRREIQGLSSDSKALERAAREDLGLVKNKEIVFTFE